ncbi:unnamed protein product [Linum trigynum]|uniref:Aminotransferase-like plant mobile domain-containing protein n=1 Tax=Linum trigynum TaxID=586398 RepID=A0AAV2DB16_9ROSI
MPFGEMTILLHDVAHILGLAVEGEAFVVDPSQLEKWALEADIRALLGLDRDDSEYGAQVGEVASLSRWYRGFGLLGVGSLTHLQQSGPPARETQCYLLLLLGSTLFIDKSKDCVSAIVNLFVKRPDMLGEYAWGGGRRSTCLSVQAAWYCLPGGR